MYYIKLLMIDARKLGTQDYSDRRTGFLETATLHFKLYYTVKLVGHLSS